jgi:hypothetical protein
VGWSGISLEPFALTVCRLSVDSCPFALQWIRWSDFATFVDVQQNFENTWLSVERWVELRIWGLGSLGGREEIGVKRADGVWKGRLDGDGNKESDDGNWLEDRRLGKDFLMYVGCCIGCARSQYFYETNSQNLEEACRNGVYWRHRASLTANQ